MANIKDKKVRFDSTTALAQALAATGDDLAKIYFTPEGKVVVNQKDYTGVKSVVAGTAKGSVKVDGVDVAIPGIPKLGDDNKIDPSYLPEGIDDIVDMTGSCFELDEHDNVIRYLHRLEVTIGNYVYWYDYTPEQKAQAIAQAAEMDAETVPEDGKCDVNLVPIFENSREHRVYAYDRNNLKWVPGDTLCSATQTYIQKYIEEQAGPVGDNILIISKAAELGGIYRLVSGNRIVELTLMPGTADDVPEKAVNPTNRYFTELRAQQAIVGSENTAAKIAALNALITNGGSGGVDVIGEIFVTVINGVQVGFKSITPPEIYNAEYTTLDDLSEVSQYIQLPIINKVVKATSVHSGAYEEVLLRYNGYEPGYGPDDGGSVVLGHLELATPNNEGKPQAADDMLYITKSNNKFYYCDNVSTAHLTRCDYKDADAQKAVVGSTDTANRVQALQDILTMNVRKVSTYASGWSKDTQVPPQIAARDDKFISEKLAYESINAVAVQLLWE